MNTKRASFKNAYQLRSNDSWTVGSNEPGLSLPEECVFHPDHVLLRDSLGDADNQWDLGFESLKDGGRSARRWHVDDCGIRLGLFHSLKSENEC